VKLDGCQLREIHERRLRLVDALLLQQDRQALIEALQRRLRVLGPQARQAVLEKRLERAIVGFDDLLRMRQQLMHPCGHRRRRRNRSQRRAIREGSGACIALQFLQRGLLQHRSQIVRLDGERALQRLHLLVAAIEATQRGGEIDPDRSVGGIFVGGLLEQLLRALQIAGHHQAAADFVQNQRMLRRFLLGLSHQSRGLIGPAFHERLVRGIDQRRDALVVPRKCIRHSFQQPCRHRCSDSVQLRKFSRPFLSVQSVAAVETRARVQRNVEEGAQVAPPAIRCRANTGRSIECPIFVQRSFML
jgi:hypothetical protein